MGNNSDDNKSELSPGAAKQLMQELCARLPRLAELIHEREILDARIVHELKKETERRLDETSRRSLGNKDGQNDGYGDIVRDIHAFLMSASLKPELLNEILMPKDDPELDAEIIE